MIAARRYVTRCFGSAMANCFKNSDTKANAGALRYFSKSVMRQDVRPIMRAQNQPSRLEVAYLQSLLNQTGVVGPQSITSGQSSNIGRLKWFILGAIISPAALVIVNWCLEEFILEGWVVSNDTQALENLRKSVLEARAERKARRKKAMNRSSQSTTEPSSTEPVDLELPSAELVKLHLELAAERIKTLEAEAMLDKTSQIGQIHRETAIKQHKHVIHTLLASGCSSSIILDDALLDSRPIKLSTGKYLEPGKAALVRVLDTAGKNQIIILAVDIQKEVETRRRTSGPDWASDCFGLDSWMLDLVDDLRSMGMNSDHGVDLICLAEGILLDVGTRRGFRTLMEYDTIDVPVGFPLQQLRQIGTVYTTASGLSNETSARDENAT